MKVYIVTCGEYSDYHICAVFLKREEAEKYAAVRNNEPHCDDYYIETYESSDGTVQVEKYYKAIDTMYYDNKDLEIESIWDDVECSLKPIDLKIIRCSARKYRIIYPFEGDLELQFDRIKKDIQDKIAEFKAKEAGIV